MSTESLTGKTNAPATEQMRSLLAAWDGLGAERWRETGLPFSMVLTHRAQMIANIIEAARELVRDEAAEAT